ncbi:EscU/YscU/HrcU family type III secretion system export apparatus switch protein [Vibrio sp. MEBiC08052]|uniref:EscU/YscU/HrcU family type III secretion system export apparatus switch protein n=1 Tax=Vibrio sp. MEBiC08052 TaxID=1761910 RepID=UPI0007406D55|nr:EscU/YscU/HrcU family type III secretion system export apparatus switch protein [Vibrio sp. MEBiC08052]KUI97030.1 hypothetical protein VRK_38850 [Vibrio sp. MEBiC08052]
MSGQDQNKSEQPTPFKLSEAKKKGQVAKSVEFSGMMSVLMFLPIGYAVSGWVSDEIKRIFDFSLFSVGQYGTVNGEYLTSWAWEVLSHGFVIILPVLFLALMLNVVNTVCQIGFIWAKEPFKLDIKRLNPITNLKKLFSKRILFEIVKTLLKLSAVACVVWWQWNDIYEKTVALRHVEPSHYTHAILRLLLNVGLLFGGVLLLFAIADLIFVKRSYIQQMKMSVQEVKDEYKKREGDPGLKSKRKTAQLELLRRLGGLAKVKDADIIITNPTHFAVALKYQPHEMVAPVLLASGRGFFASLIRQQGRKYSVPIQRSPALTRSIYKHCKIGQPISAEHYDAVASLYRALWREQRNTQ